MVPIDAASLPRSEPTEIRKSPKIDLRKNSATATKLKNNPARIIISTIRKETATHSNTQKLHIQRTWSVTACKVFSWILYGRRGWLDNERQTNAPKQYLTYINPTHVFISQLSFQIHINLSTLNSFTTISHSAIWPKMHFIICKLLNSLIPAPWHRDLEIVTSTTHAQHFCKSHAHINTLYLKLIVFPSRDSSAVLPHSSFIWLMIE